MEGKGFQQSGTHGTAGLGCGRGTSCFKASRQAEVQLHSQIMSLYPESFLLQKELFSLLASCPSRFRAVCLFSVLKFPDSQLKRTPKSQFPRDFSAKIKQREQMVKQPVKVRNHTERRGNLFVRLPCPLHNPPSTRCLVPIRRVPWSCHCVWDGPQLTQIVLVRRSS